MELLLEPDCETAFCWNQDILTKLNTPAGMGYAFGIWLD